MKHGVMEKNSKQSSKDTIWEVGTGIHFIYRKPNKPNQNEPDPHKNCKMMQNVLFISTFALALKPEFGQLLSNNTRRLR